MASDDISQLADALSKTHVGDGELSYKGKGLKLDDAESGEKLSLVSLVFLCSATCITGLMYVVALLPVEELVREIEQCQGLRALCLEGNTVGVEAAQAIAKALESKDQLQVLNI